MTSYSQDPKKSVMHAEQQESTEDSLIIPRYCMELTAMAKSQMSQPMMSEC